MNKFLSLAMLVITSSVVALAQYVPPQQTPEIDATAAVSAIALLSGALMVLRSRRRK